MPWRDWEIGSILEASNGKQALDVFLRERPDLVVTDIRMPVMDGVELARRLHEESPEAGVIMLSAYSDLAYLRAAMQSRAVDYLMKPVDLAELERAVKSALEARRRHEETTKHLRMLDRNRTLLLENYWLSLLESEPQGEAEAIEGLASLGFDAPMGAAWYAVDIRALPGPGDDPHRSAPPPAQKEIASLLLESFRGWTRRAVASRGDLRWTIVVGTERGAESDDAEAVAAAARECKERLELRFPFAAAARTTRRAFALHELHRCRAAMVDASMSPEAGGDDEGADRQRRLVQSIKRLIEERYHDDTLTVNDIAEQVNYTNAYVCMVFKKATGVTINHYMNMYRLRVAKKLLEDPNLKLFEVAIRAGYANENYFSKVFKKYENASPSEYRRGRA